MGTKDKASSVMDVSPAQKLIAAARYRSKVENVAPEVRSAITEVIAHNATVSGNHGRVSATALIRMLQDDYRLSWGNDTLDKYCRVVLGRKSFGTP